MDRETYRRQVLLRLGAEGPTVDQVLAFNLPPHPSSGALWRDDSPLGDEPHLKAWREYAERAEQIGAWAALRERFVQTHFPIREGISSEAAYLRATQAGLLPEEAPCSPAHGLQDPNSLKLILHPSIAGTIPAIAASNRQDFVTLVRVFACRNEPKAVPDSMGACLISGLNNWDRVRTYQQVWERAQASEQAGGSWHEEFHRLAAHPELYQDRFIILSSGPYSNVRGRDIGLAEENWQHQSLRIRLEHECAHYFTLRVFGRLGHNVLEELIADFCGLVGSQGTYESSLALRFLGLEAYPRIRSDGRIHIYLGGLSVAAAQLVQLLSRMAVEQLQALFRRFPRCAEDRALLARMVGMMTPMSLEEVAAGDMTTRVSTTRFGD